MEQAGSTRAPSRDYQSLSGTGWSIMDTLYSRRSHRRYLPGEDGFSHAGDLSRLLDLACRCRGAQPGGIRLISDPPVVESLKSAAYRGLGAKINMWLPRSPLKAFLVLDLESADVKAERPSGLPRAVMALEDAVLWLTERGLATCWLAGVNEREIMKVLKMDAGRSVPAVISVGNPAPPPGKLTGYSRLAYRALSCRRKPLSGIARTEDSNIPYSAAEFEPGSFDADSRGVEGLLSSIEASNPASLPAPLALAVDACLEGARVAPSGNNAQDWLFVVIRDRVRLSRLEKLCEPGRNHPWQAAVVAAGASLKLERLFFNRPFWMIDTPIAISHLTLVAASAGYRVDTCLDGIDEPGIKSLVKLPGSFRVAGVAGLA